MACDYIWQSKHCLYQSTSIIDIFVVLVIANSNSRLHINGSLRRKENKIRLIKTLHATIIIKRRYLSSKILRNLFLVCQKLFLAINLNIFNIQRDIN